MSIHMENMVTIMLGALKEREEENPYLFTLARRTALEELSKLADTAKRVEGRMTKVEDAARIAALALGNLLWVAATCPAEYALTLQKFSNRGEENDRVG